MTALPSPRPAAEAPILAIVASAVRLAHELLEVLRREGEALAAMRLEAPTGFADAKNRLVVAYSYKLEELQEAPPAPGAETALAELKALNAEVMAAARRNAAALEGALEGNRRLLDIVITAMNQSRTPATVGYSRVGNRAAPPRRSNASSSMMITRNL